MAQMLFVGGPWHGEVHSIPDGQPHWRLPSRAPRYGTVYTRRVAYVYVSVEGTYEPRFFKAMTCTNNEFMIDQALALARAADPEWRPDFLERPTDDRP